MEYDLRSMLANARQEHRKAEHAIELLADDERPSAMRKAMQLQLRASDAVLQAIESMTEEIIKESNRT